MASLQGVDVSSFQRNLDYAQIVKAGVAFAWCKATEGLSIVDGTHDQHSIGFRAASVPTGSYHFAHTSHDPHAEADFFVPRAFYDQLRPFVDMEALSQGKVPPNAGPWCMAFLARVEANTGVRPLVYGSTSYLAGMLAQCGALAAEDVWCAEYHIPPSPDRIPTMPHGWPQERMLVWQWTGSGRLPGCPTAIDRDVLIVGDLDSLMVSKT